MLLVSVSEYNIHSSRLEYNIHSSRLKHSSEILFALMLHRPASRSQFLYCMFQIESGWNGIRTVCCALCAYSVASVEEGHRVDSGGAGARRSGGPEEARLGIVVHIRVSHAATDSAPGYHAVGAQRAQLRPRFAFSLVSRYSKSVHLAFKISRSIQLAFHCHCCDVMTRMISDWLIDRVRVERHIRVFLGLFSGPYSPGASSTMSGLALPDLSVNASLGDLSSASSTGRPNRSQKKANRSRPPISSLVRWPPLHFIHFSHYTQYLLNIWIFREWCHWLCFPLRFVTFHYVHPRMHTRILYKHISVVIKYVIQ